MDKGYIFLTPDINYQTVQGAMINHIIHYLSDQLLTIP